MNSISCVNASNSSEENTVNTSREKANSSESNSDGSNNSKSALSLEIERTTDVRIAKLESKLENMEKMLEQSNKNQAWMEEMLILLIDEPPVVGKRKHLEIQKKLKIPDNIDESANEDSTRHKRDDLQSIISQYEKEMKRKSEELDSLRKSYQLLETELRSMIIWKDEVEKQKKENEMFKEQNNKLQKELDEAKSRISLLSGLTAEIEIKPKKYLILSDDSTCDESLFNEQDTQIINIRGVRGQNFLPDILANISSCHKDLFINIHISLIDSSDRLYPDIILYCREWKRRRPDGEIHVLRWLPQTVIAAEPPTQLTAYVTSFKDFFYSYEDWQKQFISFVASEWSKYSAKLLSEENKLRYFS